MHSSSQLLLTLGGILLLGLLTSALSKKIFLPRVTLLLIFGIIIGKDVLAIIPPSFTHHFETIADMTLLMVGFLLGGKLTKSSLCESGSQAFWISISAALLTALLVTSGLVFVGLPFEISLILGCIASATAPAAIMDVILESKTDNKFTKLLLSIVALDDLWALFLFCLGIAVAGSINGSDDGSFFTSALQEVGGAVLLGLLLGFPASYFTGRIKEGQPIIAEALGLVFLCGGLALHFEVSYLIASIVMGMIVTNFAQHHEYPFHAIEDIEWPFMLTFFVLAGASLELSALKNIQIIGLVYIIGRGLGKYYGALIGSHYSNTDPKTKKWLGMALLPQAGVPIGMALVAANQFPEYKQTLLSIVISSTVLFELIGPILTKVAVKKSNEII
jgi:Kef-type K+ transport system membrane component KefB